MTIDLNRVHRILIIQYQPFGDVLLNTGYLAALRRKFPQAQIDFLVRKPYDVVLQENPYLDDVLDFRNGRGWRYVPERIKLIRRIRRRNYDLLIDQIRSTGSAQIALFSGAKYRLGFDHRRWKSLYNIRVRRGPNRYYASMKFDLLKPLGIAEEPYQLFFHIRPESTKYIRDWLASDGLLDQKLICFSPGSPVKRKKWNPQQYAKLADLIQQKTDRRVIMLWGPGEKTDVDRICGMMEYKPVVAPPTDFNQAAALLKFCELLICNDGGLNHLSVAVGTPSIALFGSIKPARWSAANFPGHYYFFNPGHPSREDDTFGITAEEVFARVQEILRAADEGKSLPDQP